MKVFIIGVAGGVGRRVAQQLLARGHEASGLVRRAAECEDLSRQGVRTTRGDLIAMTVNELAEAIRHHDAVIFSAGAGGRGGTEATSHVDGEGPPKAAAATEIAGVKRFMLVSVYPEAWRERPMPDEFEHYMVEKKKAEIELVRTDLDWVILRPSALINESGRGLVSLGPAEIHGKISRDDVAATLVALIQEPKISRQILEVTNGATAIVDAISALKH